MKKEDLQDRLIQPINKHILLIPREIKNDKRIVLPGSSDKTAAGYAFLEALIVDPACQHVKKGDYCVAVPGAQSMAKFKIIDDEYLVIHEDDVMVIVRKKDVAQ